MGARGLLAGVLPSYQDVGRQGPVLCIEVKGVPIPPPSSFAGGGRDGNGGTYFVEATPERPLCGAKTRRGTPCQAQRSRKQRFACTEMLDRAERNAGRAAIGRRRRRQESGSASPSRSCPRRRDVRGASRTIAPGRYFCSQWGGRALRSRELGVTRDGHALAGDPYTVRTAAGNQKAVNCTYLRGRQDDMVDGYLPEASLRGITVWSMLYTTGSGNAGTTGITQGVYVAEQCFVNPSIGLGITQSCRDMVGQLPSYVFSHWFDHAGSAGAV